MRIRIDHRLADRSDPVIGFCGIALVVLIWCGLTYGGVVPPLFLPTPGDVWRGLADLNNRHWLIPAILRSFLRVSESLSLIVLIGVPIGVLMGAFAPVDAFLRKIVNGAKSVPTTAIVGLIVLWFSVEERAKIVFLFIGGIFYMIILVKNAVLKVPEQYIRVALDLGANRRQIIRRVLLPGAMPQIWDAIAVCNGIMWTYIVLAEFINSSEDRLGLGYLLFIGSRTQNSGQVFATLAVIAVLSSFTDYLLQSIRQRFLDW
jgi:NitT/TauT family transport system permease protein